MAMGACRQTVVMLSVSVPSISKIHCLHRIRKPLLIRVNFLPKQGHLPADCAILCLYFSPRGYSTVAISNKTINPAKGQEIHRTAPPAGAGARFPPPQNDRKEDPSMTQNLPDPQALYWPGGGAKGSYQVGVWLR